MWRRTRLPIFLTVALGGNSSKDVSAMMMIMIGINEKVFSPLNLLLVSRRALWFVPLPLRAPR